MQILFQILCTVRKHVLNAPVEEILLSHAFVLRVFELIFGDLLDDFTLICGH